MPTPTSWILAASLTVLFGCGASGGEASAPSSTSTYPTVVYRPCGEVYAAGATTDETVFDQTCRESDGELHVYGTAIAQCTDGRRLAHNDAGWGYIGQPWHTYPPGDEQVAPAVERKRCEP